MTSYYVLKPLGPHSVGDVVSFNQEQVAAGFTAAPLLSAGVIRAATGPEQGRAVPSQIVVPIALRTYTSEGAPADGLYAHSAPQGAICVDVTASPPAQYVNTGTILAPVWTASGRDAVADATTGAVGVVKVTTAPSGAHPVALTTDSTVMPASLLGATGTTATAGNDARLADARTPTVHATSHEVSGSDAIQVDQLGSGAADNHSVAQSDGSGATQFGPVDPTALPDATVSTVGGVEVDHAPVSGHPIALTQAGTSLPATMLGVAVNQALGGGGALRLKANAASDFSNPHTFAKGVDFFIGVDVADFELDLPDATTTTDGTMLILKNRNQTGTTVKTFSTQTIDGVDCSVSPYALSGAYGTLRLQCDDGAWWSF